MRRRGNEWFPSFAVAAEKINQRGMPNAGLSGLPKLFVCVSLCGRGTGFNKNDSRKLFSAV